MENLAKRNVERLEGELGSINIFVRFFPLKRKVERVRVKEGSVNVFKRFF